MFQISKMIHIFKLTLQNLNYVVTPEKITQRGQMLINLFRLTHGKDALLLTI